jgi:hypothetical protein
MEAPALQVGSVGLDFVSRSSDGGATSIHGEGLV